MGSEIVRFMNKVKSILLFKYLMLCAKLGVTIFSAFRYDLHVGVVHRLFD